MRMKAKPAFIAIAAIAACSDPFAPSHITTYDVSRDGNRIVRQTDGSVQHYLNGKLLISLDGTTATVYGERGTFQYRTRTRGEFKFDKMLPPVAGAQWVRRQPKWCTVELLEVIAAAGAVAVAFDAAAVFAAGVVTAPAAVAAGVVATAAIANYANQVEGYTSCMGG